MKKILFIFALLFICGIYLQQAAESENKITKVCINGICVEAEVVDTDQTREKGLMYRDSLPQQSGMLFVYDKEGKYGYYMKNMKIPLDIIWISSEKEVVSIVEDLQPCKTQQCEVIVPIHKAQFVLEVNAGFVKKHQINVGDKVEF